MMARKSEYRALDQTLAADPSTILNATEIRAVTSDFPLTSAPLLRNVTASTEPST